MTSNIGYDVGGGQFDIMIPYGGVGLFNRCAQILGNNLGKIQGHFYLIAKMKQAGMAAMKKYMKKENHTLHKNVKYILY